MKKTGNQSRFFIITGSILLIGCILIKIARYHPNWIEVHYSNGIYQYISSFYRNLFGWIPFSVGDILYFLAGCYLIWFAGKTIKIVIRGQVRTVNYQKRIKRAFYFLTITYIYFNLTWGMNYNRPGIAAQLALTPIAHNKEDLQMIAELLVKKLNETRLQVSSEKIKFKQYKSVFAQAQQAYVKKGLAFPFMAYKTSSVKRSMYGRLGNYLGFLGYYNPFTGEAQLNLTMPQFLIPYVSCHEMAHQLGYAKESEASFVGYLAAVQSEDALFHYSAYFDMFTYANYELFRRDSLAAKTNFSNLDTLVKIDFREYRTYSNKRKNPIEPFITVFYDYYLKANDQDKGVNSYNEVLGWLIAYYKKYHSI